MKKSALLLILVTFVTFPCRGGQVADYCNDLTRLIPAGSVKLPKNWPADVPAYPQAKLVQSVDADRMLYAYYCTQDSFDSLANYFFKESASWKLKKRSPAAQPGIAVSGKTIVFEGSQGENHLTIALVNDAGQTQITTMLERAAPPKPKAQAPSKVKKKSNNPFVPF